MTAKRGFASPNYDPWKAREVRRMGMRALDDAGKKHRWTREEAKAASLKGVEAQRRRRAASQVPLSVVRTEDQRLS